MKLSRREWLRVSSLAAGTTVLAPAGLINAQSAWISPPIAFFEKPLQLLEAEEMAKQISSIGFDGVEATIRKGGRIDPAQAPDELPAYVATLQEYDLDILIMATSISRVDQPHAEDTLRTAANLGIKRYRLAGFRYDLNKPVLSQLDALKPQLHELAALNRELGMTAVYQNHAGGRNVGGQVWDLHYLMKDMKPEEIAIAYDIRHAKVEGLSAWKVNFQLVRPWIQAVYVKDFIIEKTRAVNVPMGEGIVGNTFYQGLKQEELSVPVSLHVPYLKPKTREQALEGISDIKRDYSYLKRQLL